MTTSQQPSLNRGELPEIVENEERPSQSNDLRSQQIQWSTCRICLSSLHDPAKLLCGHCFCESCLNKYWKANEEPNFVVCPLCRNYTSKIGFIQKDSEIGHSTRDFRKKFDSRQRTELAHSTTSEFSLMWTVMPVLFPICYFIVESIMPFIINLLH